LVFGLVFQGAARPPWGWKISARRAGVGRLTEWFPDAALDLFVLVGGILSGCVPVDPDPSMVP
jgi:hypothetical protein